MIDINRLAISIEDITTNYGKPSKKELLTEEIYELILSSEYEEAFQKVIQNENILFSNKQAMYPFCDLVNSDFDLFIFVLEKGLSTVEVLDIPQYEDTSENNQALFNVIKNDKGFSDMTYEYRFRWFLQMNRNTMKLFLEDDGRNILAFPEDMRDEYSDLLPEPYKSSYDQGLL